VRGSERVAVAVVTDENAKLGLVGHRPEVPSVAPWLPRAAGWDQSTGGDGASDIPESPLRSDGASAEPLHCARTRATAHTYTPEKASGDQQSRSKHQQEHGRPDRNVPKQRTVDGPSPRVYHGVREVPGQPPYASWKSQIPRSGEPRLSGSQISTN
jgi:hypothetical protein